MSEQNDPCKINRSKYIWINVYLKKLASMELFVSLPYDLCRTYKCSQIFSFVHIACKSTIFAKRSHHAH